MGKFDSYLEAWRKRSASQGDQQKRRSEQLLAVATRCADYLVRHFGVQRVYLFGSLVTEAATHSRSDIDLAVEGLPSHLYFKALSGLWDFLPTGVELDLVPIEDADPSLQEKIKMSGKLLYECQ